MEQLLAPSPDNLGNTSPKLVMGVPRDIWDKNVAKGKVNFEENIQKNLENNEILDFYQSVQLRGKSLLGSSSTKSKKGKNQGDRGRLNNNSGTTRNSRRKLRRKVRAAEARANSRVDDSPEVLMSVDENDTPQDELEPLSEAESTASVVKLSAEVA